MQLLPLQDVASQLRPGGTVPWGVRDSNGKLLLARGQGITDSEMLQSLLRRGMFVDAQEVRAAAGRSDPVTPPPESFFGRWRLLYTRLNTLLQAPPADLYAPMVEVLLTLWAMGEQDPDKMLFQIVRHDAYRHQTYGVSHALHVAAVCLLTSRRLGWEEARRRSLVGAALTMNISMVDLQGRLAAQAGPLTPEQRAQVQAHPLASEALLRARGVTDPAWLAGVAQHHESPRGDGYPTGTTEPCELSQVLRVVDIFTAKLATRASRQGLLPHQAARQLFVANPTDPVTASLIKEFGIYPPGCFVKLASGETGLVVRRGAAANMPMVAAITNRNGDPLSQPIPRDSSVKDHAVLCVVPESNVMVRIPWESLYRD